MRILIYLFIFISFFSCKNKKEIPDVSHIKINLTTQRFEKKLFSIDTARMENEFDFLFEKNSPFREIFLYNILGADPSWTRSETISYLNKFISTFKNLNDTAQKIFNDFSPYEKEIKKLLQYVKYYFPTYKVPEKIITYIGPLDLVGDGISEDALIVGLHHHLGKNFSAYSSAELNQIYPRYITKRFEPDHIVVNCAKNIIDDIFPEKKTNGNTTLIVEMVEQGKFLYVLNQILPYHSEYKIIGYDENQYKFCVQKEVAIWDFFVQNELLQKTEKNIIRNYIGESPKTQEFGDDSPGNIGAFVGWQIVKKYMKKNEEKSLTDLMKTDAKTIYQEAKYKP